MKKKQIFVKVNIIEYIFNWNIQNSLHLAPIEAEILQKQFEIKIQLTTACE